MRQSTQNLFRRPFLGQAQDEYQVGLLAIRNKDFADAIKSLEPLVVKYKDNFVLWYQLARCYAQENLPEKAADALRKSARFGGPTYEFVKSDSYLDPARQNPAFKKVAEALARESFDFLPSQGFRSRYAWQPNGARATGAHTGRKYFLSTILGVTTPDRGNTDEEVLNYLKSAIDADATKPKGKFYFTVTGDVRSKTRLRGFPIAIRELKKLGYTAETVKAILPKNKHDILGCSIGRSTWKWSTTNSKILPGAICENLTSYGGVMKKGNSQTPLTEFLRYGAAGSSGTIYEPYAIQAKFPHPMIHVHYARGCSLAEAFYQSVHGPFQLLIVGEPLCQPFASPQKFTVTGLKADQEVSGQVEITLRPENGKDSLSHFEVFTDGVFRGRASVGQKITFDTRDLSDGYHELRIVGVANHAIETRSRAVIPFMVNNSKQSVQIQTATPQVRLGRKVEISVAAEGASRITLYQNSRKIDSVRKDRGTVEVSTSILGEGPTSLYAVAEINGKKIESQRLELTISK